MKIPRVPLVLAPDTPEAKQKIGFKFAGEPIGNRSQIGGEPDWIQYEEVPKCECRKKMTFYGQLDSLGDEVCLGDCGMIYVFICMDCLKTESVFQCY